MAKSHASQNRYLNKIYLKISSNRTFNIIVPVIKL